MNVVPQGMPLAFGYGAYDEISGLFIALQVYDITALPTTVLLVTTPATYVVTGGYAALYTPSSPNKAYMAVMAVYTDDTYTILDSTRSPVVETFNTGPTVDIVLSSEDLTDIAEAVWQLMTSGNTPTGSFGAALSNIQTTVDDLADIAAPVEIIGEIVGIVEGDDDE